MNDIDYSKEITIKHLMSNTSGIPDYFSSTLVSELTAGKDQKWGFDRTIAYAKQQKPKFPPGKKAQYSDTNYQLLGKIIELVTEKDIQTVFKEYIFDELDLKETYLYEDMNDSETCPIVCKREGVTFTNVHVIHRTRRRIVSTARESMIFLKTFIKGHLFPITYFGELKEWKLLFGPGLFYYGVGIASQPVSFFELKDGLIGHWGQSGSFAFYHPKTDLYFTGTVNQFYGHGIAAKKIIKIIKSYKKIEKRNSYDVRIKMLPSGDESRRNETTQTSYRSKFHWCKESGTW